MSQVVSITEARGAAAQRLPVDEMLDLNEQLTLLVFGLERAASCAHPPLTQAQEQTLAGHALTVQKRYQEIVSAVMAFAGQPDQGRELDLL